MTLRIVQGETPLSGNRLSVWFDVMNGDWPVQSPFRFRVIVDDHGRAHGTVQHLIDRARAAAEARLRALTE